MRRHPEDLAVQFVSKQQGISPVTSKLGAAFMLVGSHGQNLPDSGIRLQDLKLRLIFRQKKRGVSIAVSQQIGLPSLQYLCLTLQQQYRDMLCVYSVFFCFVFFYVEARVVSQMPPYLLMAKCRKALRNV